MTNTELLKSIIKDSGYKMEFLAMQIGVSRASFSMKINNISAFKVSEMYGLCELLNIDEEKTKEIFFVNKVAKTDT